MNRENVIQKIVEINNFNNAEELYDNIKKDVLNSVECKYIKCKNSSFHRFLNVLCIKLSNIMFFRKKKKFKKCQDTFIYEIYMEQQKKIESLENKIHEIYSKNLELYHKLDVQISKLHQKIYMQT